MLAATALAVALGLHLPARRLWRDLAVVALATSGVFTLGVFFATSAYPLGPVLAEVKIDAIATGIGVPLAVLAAWVMGAGRFAHPDGRHQVARHHPLPRAHSIGGAS
jgi:hypothetical protein